MTIRGLALLFLIFLAGCTRPAPPQTVILIGLDGFRWDYLEKFQPPTLARLAKEGVRAGSMTPSFPTMTFPNFYTLATGLRPEHHGIIANTMYDPVWKERFALGSASVQDGKWWGGEPIWITAEKQGVRSACMFWPGSEAEIKGLRPTEWRPFKGDVTPTERVQTVLGWLALPPDKRPRLITLYFQEADSAAHRHGPDAPATADAVKVVDEALASLLAGIRQLGLESEVNLILAGDHGMTELSPDRIIVLRNLVGLNKVQIDFSGPTAGLRPLEGTADELYQQLAARQEHFKVYRREDIPERLHFRDNPRIPDVVMIPEEGWTIVRDPLTETARTNFLRAGHGFDPAFKSMGATFIAWGPAFRKGVTLPPFDNTEVYDLACATLGLKPAPNDGTGQLARKVLKN